MYAHEELEEARMGKPVYTEGDIVRMKKKHPCGSDTWKVLRTGIEFYMECTGCGHRMRMERPKFMKAAKAIVAYGSHIESIEETANKDAQVSPVQRVRRIKKL